MKKGKDMGELCNVVFYEAGNNSEDDFKPTCICRRDINIDHIAIIDSGADQSADKSCESMQRK